MAFWLHGPTQRQWNRSLKIYVVVVLVLGIGNALVQYGWLSGRWVLPMTHLLWFWLGLPAGLHFFSVRNRELASEVVIESASAPRRLL